MNSETRTTNVLMTTGIVLLVLWLLGLISSFTLGGIIYLALVLGLALVVIGLVTRGRIGR